MGKNVTKPVLQLQEAFYSKNFGGRGGYFSPQSSTPHPPLPLNPPLCNVTKITGMI